jgi:hypothetical protein
MENLYGMVFTPTSTALELECCVTVPAGACITNGCYITTNTIPLRKHWVEEWGAYLPTMRTQESNIAVRQVLAPRKYIRHGVRR